MQQVEVRRRIAGPIQEVWQVYTDHASWTDWAGLGKVRLERQGSPGKNGVGCVRAISNAGISAHEEVLSFDPPKRMTYRLVKGGLPIKGHLGEVTFEEEQGGTLVIWRCRFDSRLPGLGFPLRLIVSGVFRKTLRNLARKRFPEG